MEAHQAFPSRRSGDAVGAPETSPRERKAISPGYVSVETGAMERVQGSVWGPLDDQSGVVPASEPHQSTLRGVPGEELSSLQSPSLGNGRATSSPSKGSKEWRLSQLDLLPSANGDIIHEGKPGSAANAQLRRVPTVIIPWHRRFSQWFLRHLNYRWIFVCYVVLVPLLAAGFGAAILHGEIPFIDTYYMTTSAFTETGLNSVNMTTMNNGFLALLFIMIMIGSQIFTVFFPPLIKRRLYWHWYGALIRRERYLRQELSQYAARGEDDLDEDDEESIYGVDESTHDRAASMYASLSYTQDTEPPKPVHADHEFSSRERSTSLRITDLSRSISYDDGLAPPDVEANGVDNQSRLDTQDAEGDRAEGDRVDGGVRARPSGRATSKDFSGRNALYQRRSICLEGNEFARNAVLEFEAMGKLIMLNAIFYGGLMAIFFPLVYAAVVSPPGPSPAIAESGATTGWFSVFTSLSALHNCGLTLVNTSLVPVANQPGVLFLLGTLILIGNTGLPVVLYLLVRIARRFARDKAPWDYLLVHGRKFSIFLFNGAQTLLLGIILVILLLIQFVAFLALNLNRSDLLVSYSAGSLVYLGAFQSVCTRNAGFTVVSLRAVSPALLVLFAVMMYLSPVPYVLTLRTSMPSSSSERKRAEPIQRNDAEYASLTTTHGAASGTTTSPVLYEIGKTFGNLLVFDIAWLFMALFVICIAENYILRNSIEEVETLGTVTVFDILFEIASAYGNVGYSIGVNNNDFSLSGIFSVFSKLVIIATMYGGRIRSIPQSSDEAARFRFDRNMMDVTQSSLLRPTLRLRALERRSSRSIQAERPVARGKQR
ncbi:hypothetical protein CCYA_CCYA10G2974 [Cyanidiococcus yangmingshanensis]|nr:hypothetical protein CCYA_CCYA10G2974 [Cyanidiococcus yangmingshanensis]